MQAIQAIENAALQAPRPSSPFRALVWKEWRQQRWIFLSLAGLAYALLLSALIVAKSGILHGDEVLVVVFLCACAAFIGAVSVLTLSANAFSGEREDNTEQFLETIPCSRSKLFRVKLGFVLFLVLLGLIPLATAAVVSEALQPHMDFAKLIEVAGHIGPKVVAGVLALAIIPALVASFGGSVIGTILASMPVVAVCAAYVILPAVLLLAPFLPMGWAASYEVLVTVYAVLTLAALLLAAWRMWSRAERTWRSSLRTSAATAGLLVALAAVLLATVYLYVFFLAPLRSFIVGNHGPCSFSADVSPDGRYATYNIIIQCSGRRWYKTRAALVDIDSGRARWLTRCRNSEVLGARNRIWSPSGDQFVLAEGGVWPGNEAGPEPKLTVVVDARSGERRRLDDLCPGLAQMRSKIMNAPPWPLESGGRQSAVPPLPLIGWCGDHVIAFYARSDILFADIQSHQVELCKTPVGIGSPFAWGLNITRRGIFTGYEDVSVKGELRVPRYAPDLPEAACLLLHGLLRNMNRSSYWMNYSEDGKWALLNAFVSGGQPRFSYLAQLDDGAKAALLVSSDAGEKGLIAPSWRVTGFLPDGHQILLYSDAELGLFDPDSHDLRRIPITSEGRGWPIVYVQPSPAGGFALVGLNDRATSGAPGGEPLYVMVDLHKGACRAIYDGSGARRQNLRWMCEDRLISEQYGKMPLVINRDGSGARRMMK